MHYYDVAVNFPKAQSVLTYKSPLLFKKGDLVSIPLGPRRTEKGCVLNQRPCDEVDFDVKEISSPLESLRLDAELLSLLSWMSLYYHYPLGKLIFDTVPFCEKSQQRKRPLKIQNGLGHPLPFTLNSSQQEITKKISKNLTPEYSSHLIHGVTGSGKTAVYLRLIQEVLARGDSVLFLLPEINLTAQSLDFFKSHLNVPLFCYHGSLTTPAKFALWSFLQKDDTPKIVVGARSALFLPIKRLKLIVVDEEHDLSFKQDDRCPYHARNVAMKKAQLGHIPIILGSATPSTDTLMLFEKNPQNYHRMTSRIEGSALPQIQLIDIREKRDEKKPSPHWPLSSGAVAEISLALAKREQVLIFINRLGYAQYLQCRACGHQFFCPNCSVPLKYFKAKNQVQCSHCEYKASPPMACPSCDNVNLLQKGFGTEKIQEVVQGLFPDRAIERFDREDLTTVKKIEARLNEFHQGKIDVLVGTQMLSKGHNFRRVNLVLLLGLDALLSYPDFRAREKVFQQISQVSGRSGRFGKRGKVLLQTFMPEAKIYADIKENKVDSFYQEELSLRKEFHYPPFVRMAIIYLHARSSEQVGLDAKKLKQLIHSAMASNKETAQHFKAVEIYGPRACSIEKRAGQFSQMILVKSAHLNALHDLIRTIHVNFRPHHSTSVKFDIDPVNIF